MEMQEDMASSPPDGALRAAAGEVVAGWAGPGSGWASAGQEGRGTRGP